jgi:hypothetical protein
MYSQVVFFGGPLLALIVGASYLAKSDSGASMWRRILTSAYGPSVAAIFVLAVFAWPDQYRFQQVGVNALLGLQLVPLALLVASLRWYPGSRKLHIFLVPLALVGWLWSFALAFLLVHGE